MINSNIACIIARELIEAAMFITSYVGAVVSCPTLDKESRMSYLSVLIPSILAGMIFGLAISLGVGFGLASVMEDSADNIEYSVELGEALSKLIGFFFVASMMIKIPKWFGISNYRGRVEDEGIIPASGLHLDSRYSMCASLFWNTLRESTEGGVLTAIAALLSADAMDSLGDSVGVGIGAAFGLGLLGMVGAKYVSATVFGIAAAVMCELLAMGLITGATRAFEEVYAESHDDATTPLIYDLEHTVTGDALTSLKFLGVSDFLTVLQLLVWCLAAVILTALQIRHHYYGQELEPEIVTKLLARINASRGIHKDEVKDNDGAIISSSADKQFEKEKEVEILKIRI